MIPTQLTLFDLSEFTESGEPKAAISDDVDNYAFLYTSTETGKASGIHFMMTLNDARKFCESPVSQGCTHGIRWAYFWTSVRNYVEQYGECSDIKEGRRTLG